MVKLIWVYLKGVAMGAADVIPGVSGGTIAFITGIYERLIQAIKSINFKNLKLLFTGKIRAFWKNIDGTFLLCLILGIATSFLTLAHLVTYLLDNHPILIWAFFFGLIMASTFFVGRTVKWDWRTIIAFILFTIIAFYITSPEHMPIQSNNSYWFIFLCGAIAICAMILPGISGSFILVLLSQYQILLTALKDFNIPVILTFIAGAFIGIVSFANILSWLFKHFKMITLASLTGFMFGSLNKIWPWKHTLNTYTDQKGIVRPLTEMNISPAKFEELTGNTSQLCLAILLLVIGFVLIFAIEFISIKLKKKVDNKEIETEEEEINSVE
jgi:putative membrane protein